jgi:hypothetical protein
MKMLILNTVYSSSLTGTTIDVLLLSNVGLLKVEFLV